MIRGDDCVGERQPLFALSACRISGTPLQRSHQRGESGFGGASMKRIPLTQGYVAIIDNRDFERVSRYKWCACKCNNKIYAQTSRDSLGGAVRMHRFILRLERGNPLQADHKDGNGLNNRRRNLRRATVQQQRMNTAKIQGCVSEYKGVHFHKPTRTWNARIKFNRKFISLKYHTTEIEAARAYNAKAIELFGRFAKLNPV